MNFNDILTNITKSSTTESQKLATASQSISQLQPKISNINSILQFKPNWSILNNIRSKVSSTIRSLSTSKDQAFLAKLQRSSSNEDIYIIGALIGFILSLLLLNYLKN